MKKNKISKIVAFIALFWIIIWVAWTWFLIIFWNNNSNTSLPSQEITQEQLEEFIKSQSWTTLNTNSWSINTWTWTTINFASWSLNSNSWSVEIKWDIKE